MPRDNVNRNLIYKLVKKKSQKKWAAMGILLALAVCITNEPEELLESFSISRPHISLQVVSAMAMHFIGKDISHNAQ